MATAPFFLKCLGYPELRGPDGKTVRIRVKKHAALLVYLALERRRPHDRGRLVTLLWPRVSAPKGRHSISVALSFLRTVFGREAFPPHRSGLRFNPPNLVMDLDRLERGKVLGAEGEDDLDVDGFLQGFDIDDAPEFGFWKEREHARRLPAIHAGLLTLIDHGRRRGSHDEIMQWAERLLALDHLAEEGIRAKMEALALVGDRFSALRVFDEWKRQLAEELGAEPSAMVDGMASQLRKRGWEPKEPNPIPAVPAEQWRDRPFVGRKAEFRRLYEVWEAVKQQRPHHFVISGDSGVGKTTLAQRLVTAAGLEGASVSRVQCYQMEQRIPFGTVGGLVAGLLGRPGVAATSPEGLAELARIVPQVKDHFSNLPAPKLAEGESARLLFAEGVIDFLRAVMEERPVLLVIDDLHHADEASLAVLHMVMRRLGSGRLLLVTCHTIVPGPDDTRPRLTHVSVPQSCRLALGPMPPAEADDLLQSVLSGEVQSPSRSEQKAIVRAAGGLPLVIELLAKDWLTNGRHGIALGLPAITADLPNRQPIDSDSYSVVAERMISQLSHNAQQALNLAAVLGDRLNDLDKYSILDLTLAQALDGMRELVSRRIFRDVGNGLEFVNELVREHAYRSIPAPYRVALHQRVANQLLLQARDGGMAARRPNGLEIAWHLARSHQTNAATEHLVVGCRQALLEGAPDSVVLSVQSTLAELSDDLRPVALELLVLALHELGRWAEALQVSSPHEAASAGFRTLAIEARWQLQTIPLTEQASLIHELTTIATDDAAALSRAFSLAAFMAGRQRRDDLMAVVLERLPTVTQVDRRAHANIMIAAAQIAFHSRRHEAGEQAARDACDALLELGAANRSLATAKMGMAVFRAIRGDYRGAAALFQETATIATRLDNAELAAHARANLALTQMRIGEYDVAVATAQSAAGAPDLVVREIASYAECCSLALLNRTVAAQKRLQESSGRIGTARETWLQQAWLFQRADVLWLCDQRSRAMHEARRAVALGIASPGDRGSLGQWARWTSMLARAGDQMATETIEGLRRLLHARAELDMIDRYETIVASQRVPFEPNAGALVEEMATLWVRFEMGTREFLSRFAGG